MVIGSRFCLAPCIDITCYPTHMESGVNNISTNGRPLYFMDECGWRLEKKKYNSAGVGPKMTKTYQHSETKLHRILAAQITRWNMCIDSVVL